MLSTIGAASAHRQPATISEDTDKELIEAIAEGDRDAMRTLFIRHKTAVLRFAMRIVGDQSIAEEVTNEVFQDVWRKADRFEHRSQVSTWLMSIARNKALDARPHPSTEAFDPEFAESIVDAADDPEAAVSSSENKDIVRECLMRLSPAHRAVIDLIYFQERSIGEIAEMTRVPENTIKTRVFYARKRMEELLVGKGIDRSWRWVQ